MTIGRVYLVGAGPGDPGLLTVRAVERLRAADVVAHDELVSREILALAPPHAELLAVGRRRGQGSTPYRLHPAVLERARAGKTVVRLKAGDPLIFGRGGEEAEELAEAGIPFEIVPGITAALGAAASAAIPLTHREHASRVTFATGHAIEEARAVGGPQRETLVLYMGAHNLALNVQALLANGWKASTPAAYIASATTPSQAIVVATIGDFQEKLGAIDRKAPALVIVGDVVGVRARLQRGGAR